jgi:hypothetical protein
MIRAEPLPCVGCGYCCAKVQCAWSLAKYGSEKLCPELYWDGTQAKWRCMAADNPELAKEVGIGAGCCSPLNTERRKYA